MSQTGKTWVTLNLWSLFKYLGLNDKIRNVDKSSGLGNGQMSMRLVCLNSQHYVYNKCSLNISPDFLLTLVRIQNKVSEMNEVTQSKTKNRIRFWGIKNMDDKHSFGCFFLSAFNPTGKKRSWEDEWMSDVKKIFGLSISYYKRGLE